MSTEKSETSNFINEKQRIINAHWCSLGTSITWYNNNVSNSFTKGYQTRVMEKLLFTKFTNNGINGGILETTLPQIIKADYYTIEHGINDWGHSTPVGTIDDYINNTKNGTFAAIYRVVIDKIRNKNPIAKIILCTPRKGYGFGTFLPLHWYDEYNGIFLKQYAEIVIKIAEFESFQVADFFSECGDQENLDKLSIDVALHPNDEGYQMMADVLIKSFENLF